MIVVQHSAQSLAPFNLTVTFVNVSAGQQQPVSESLMISLAVVVAHILRDRVTKRCLRPRRPTARAPARAPGRVNWLACSPTSCFSFDMEILSFGIDLAPQDKKSQGYAVGHPINLQPPASLATTVNTFPPS